MLELHEIRQFQETVDALSEASRGDCVLRIQLAGTSSVYVCAQNRAQTQKLQKFYEESFTDNSLLTQVSPGKGAKVYLDRVPGASVEQDYSSALIAPVHASQMEFDQSGLELCALGLFFKSEQRKNAIHFQTLLSKCALQIGQELAALLQNLENPKMSFPTRMLQSSLRELSELKRALDSTMIVATTDRRGIIKHVNQKFCEVSGYDKSELIGKTHRIINSGLHPRGFWVQLWAKISKGEIWHGIIRNKRKNGDFYWVKTTIVPFQDSNSKIYQFMAIRVEITDLIQTREQLTKEKHQLKNTLQNLAKAQSSLQRSARFADLGSMAAGIAHDFNNTLSVILMGVELCLAQDPDSEISQILQRVRKTASQASYHARKLLALGSTQSVKVEAVRLEDFLEEVLVLLNPQAKSAGVEIVQDLGEFESKVFMDPRGMSDVLRNLVLNSIHAFDSYESPCQSVIKITVHGIDNHLVFTISDSGPGIARENREKIFDPFFTTKDQGSFRGTGLGLAMVYAVVKDLGGEVVMESWTPEEEPGNNRIHPYSSGTTFQIRLKLEYEVVSKHNYSEQDEDSQQFLNEEILVVDDEKYLLHYAKRALQTFGYKNVHCFSQGDKLLSWIDERLETKEPIPKVILCDLQMPGVDGLDVYAYVKKIPSSIRPYFVPMTGKATKENLKTFKDAGVNLVLEKPFALSSLRKVVSDAFNKL